MNELENGFKILELVEKCKKNDERSQLKIYKMFYKAMYNTSLRILKDKFKSEDNMQISFLKAFDKIHTYDKKLSFAGWLKKIVINNALDNLKKKEFIFEELNERNIKKYYDFSEINIQMENEKNVKNKTLKIKKAIMGLSDKYRTILSLYLIEGYDHQEICSILKISHSNSRTLFFRAKKKLKNFY